MKNLLTACLPALALFALGGCAGTSAITSSEDDGVYYSSKDRTTAVATAAPAPVSTDEEANPDYNGEAGTSAARQNSGSDQYYDNTYTYMRDVPNYGVTAYSPYSPYTSLGYGMGGFGGYGGGYGAFSPYGGGFYDPFYSSFYSPYGYGYGSSISIGFGFGRPFGFGGYGYGSPFGYAGYGGGFYDPYFYGGPFYGGYYGRGGYYGNNFYGGGYSNGGYGGNYGGGGDNNGRNRRTYGHRTDRASDGRYNTASGAAGSSTSAPGTISNNGRMRSSERNAMNPGLAPQASPIDGNDSRRVRTAEAMGATNSGVSGAENRRYNKPRTIDGSAQPQYRDLEQISNNQPLNTPQQTSRNGRSRYNADNVQPQAAGQLQPQGVAPQEGQRRRGGFFQNPGTSQAAEQPTRQRNYDRPQRTYEQPQQQRSYEQPRQEQRSYSTPSYGGGGGGGGSVGGGGGGGGRRGRD